MYIDFHTHGKLAKNLPFSTEYTEWLMREAKEAGLDAICLTEHFNTLQFDELYKYLAKVCTRDGDTLITQDGVRVFVGMETDIAEGGHILSIGKLEDILELNTCLEPYKKKREFLTFESLMNVFERYPVIVGAAHPYREGSHISELPFEQLKRLQFLDLNGKDVALDREYYETETGELAKKLNIPMISGSDTHQSVQYGCIRTKLSYSVNTVEKLYEQMKDGNYEIVVSSNIGYQVKVAGLLKKLLKEIHALGGNYVSMLTSQSSE